ncbi:aminomethyl-transferring glycine dehydrogenase subunit GcvPA [Candidatus Saganbacteria bacterium]|nr:aminomethyl-transferring glycine dehydrogenase subunit GcvPA [Candidatus Saganbacteria bacterium]
MIGLSQIELLAELRTLSEKNNISKDFLGGGIYDHFIPSALKQLISRGEFYTAYTPYQPEASQGTLQTIYEYQSLVCALTGMDAANASMYDGATAMAEAAFLACRATGRKEIVVSQTVNPMYRQVLKTYANGADLIVREIPYDQKSGLTANSFQLTEKSACLIIQQPNFFGCIEEVGGLAQKIHDAGALFIASVDPISLGLLAPPSEYGTDVVVAEGQSLGIPQNFGGPLLGIFAAKEKYLRQVPGRLVSRTVDKNGKQCFVLTLQAREQHIRRERATSNICSNEALCALSACIYLSLLGKKGLKAIAEICLQKSNYLKNKCGSSFSGKSFKEFAVKTNEKIGLDLAQYYPELSGYRLICVTELYSKADLDRFPQLRKQ